MEAFNETWLQRLALPTVAVMFLVTLLSVAETYFVSSLGTDAIAAASLVVLSRSRGAASHPGWTRC